MNTCVSLKFSKGNLPTGLAQSGNIAAHGGLTELVPAQAEPAIKAARPPGNGTAIPLPCGAGIAGQLLQRKHGLLAFFIANIRIGNQHFEFCPPGRILFNQLGAPFLAVDHAYFCHGIFLNLFLFEREIERFQQRKTLFVVFCRCCNADVHAADDVNLVVVNLGKHDLLFDTHAEVATTVERLGA